MPDKRNIEELTDQAWERMQQLLDEEMPVSGESKRRPLVWWFWAAAGVLLLLFAGWGLWPVGQQGDTGPNRLDTRAEQPVATDKTNSDTEERLENYTEPATAPATTEQLVAGRVNRPNDETTSVATAVAPQIATTSLPNSESSEETNITTESSAGISSEPGPLASLDADDIPGPLAAAEEITSVISGEDNTDATLAQVHPFETKTLPALSLKSLPLPPLQPVQLSGYEPRSSSFIPIEGYAGLIDRSTAGLNGGFVAVRSGLKLNRAGDWSLRSGVGVQLNDQPFRVDFQPSNDDFVTEEFADQGSINFDPGNSPQAVKRQTVPDLVAASNVSLRTLYLDVPLVVHWQVSPRWSLETGARMSWLLESVWRQPSQDQLGNSLDQNGYSLETSNRQLSFSQLSSSNNSSTEVSFLLNDLYLAGTLGVTFRPAARWQIRAQYQHSITNTLDSGLYRSPDRSLRLGFGVQF